METVAVDKTPRWLTTISCADGVENLGKNQRRQISRFPKLADLVDSFFELASRDRTTGIHQVIQSFAEHPSLGPTVTVPEAYPREKYLMQELSRNYSKSKKKRRTGIGTDSSVVVEDESHV
jgi:hypothetical protein